MSVRKMLGVLALLLVGVIGISAVAFAQPQITVYNVELDGNELALGTANLIQDIEKGDTVDLRIRVESNESLSNVEIEGELSGYDHNDRISDISDVFDMKANVAYTKKLSLRFPVRMDQDGYQLMINVMNRGGLIAHKEYALEIDTQRHSLEIKDIVVSPEDSVKAGRALLTSVRLKNRGEIREQDVKIKVSIPELGISQSEYVDDVDAECTNNSSSSCDDSLTTEEIFMRIPDNAKSGEYLLKVEVEYDDGDEQVSSSTKINVVAADDETVPAPEAPGKTIVTIGSDIQPAVAGGAAVIYPITLANTGSTSRSYTISADGGNWATVTLSPSNVIVLGAGESKSVYAYVSAKDDAAAGEQIFSIEIKSGDTVLKQVPLKVLVTSPKASGFDNLKKALEIGLIVLVVLLVIVGLILGFNKLKGNDNEELEDEEGQTYY